MAQPLPHPALSFLLSIESRLNWNPSCNVRGVQFKGASPPPFDVPILDEPWDLLISVLRSAQYLLALAQPGLPLRHFVEAMVKAVPPNPSDRQGVLLILRKLISFKWSRLLNLDCEAVAFLLDCLVRDYEGIRDSERELQQRESEMSKVGKERWKKLVCTPVPFQYKRRKYYFPFLQSLLLECLRAREPVGELDVLQHVYGGVDGDDRLMSNRLHKLQGDTNDSLLKKKLPLVVSRPVPGQLRLTVRPGHR
jgi:hypothetical protein